MGNPRSFTTNYVAIKTKLEKLVKPVRSDKKRRELMHRAASGRDPQLSSKARHAVAERRRQAEIQASLDMIAGRV
ncbi:hypothetical protein [Devosia sp. A369]